MVISFIVEAFVFKIQATQKRRECSRHPNSDCNCKRGIEHWAGAGLTVACMRYRALGWGWCDSGLHEV